MKPGQSAFITAQKPKTKKDQNKKVYFYVKTMHIAVVQIVVAVVHHFNNSVTCKKFYMCCKQKKTTIICKKKKKKLKFFVGLHFGAHYLHTKFYIQLAHLLFSLYLFISLFLSL